jgi:hypothetical protein
MPEPQGQPRRQHRWGIYTLAFLTLSFVMVVLSSTHGQYTPLTLFGLVAGFVGAGWCTVKGFRVARDFRLPGSPKPRPPK